MGFIKRALTNNQVRKDKELFVEEKIYEHVSNEIESGEIRPGLWTKASTTAASSNPEDIKREYARLRVEQLYAEGRLFNQLLKETSGALVAENTISKIPLSKQSHNAEESASEQYKRANQLRYEKSDLNAAIKLYKKIIKEHPYSAEAVYSLDQIEMIQK
jgi:hypothetical protein